MSKRVTTAEFLACSNALNKTGKMSKAKSDEIFKTLEGAEKIKGYWRVSLSSFREYIQKEYGDVLKHRKIIDPVQLIEKYTYEYTVGGDNWV